jgi:hypothetical protein
MRKQIGIFTLASFLLVAASISSVALAAPTGTNYRFLTNYTVGGTYAGNYSKGGSTIVVNITVATCNEAPDALGVGCNVSALLYNNSAQLYLSEPLINRTSNGNGEWSTTYTVPDIGVTGYAIVFNVSDSTGGNTYRIGNFSVDATDPSVSVTCTDPSGGMSSCPTSQTWRTITGNSKNICWTATDTRGVAAGSGTITITAPTGSALTSETNTTSGSTSIEYCYVFTPDVIGTYTFSVTPVDNVTNSGTASAHSISFAMPEDDTGVFTQTGGSAGNGEVTTPNVEIPTTGDMWSYIIGGFQSIWNMAFGWIHF